MQNWEKFEIEVAEVFEMFGYKVDRNTKTLGGQTDVLATSHRREIPNLLIECKYSNNPTKKVGVDEVENFIARAIQHRMNGLIDHAYLVTNTDFTPDAKQCLDTQLAKNFVYLITYPQLIDSIVSPDAYLQEYSANYVGSDEEKQHVDLTVVDTTLLDKHSSELMPGDIFYTSEEESVSVVIADEWLSSLMQAEIVGCFENDWRTAIGWGPLVNHLRGQSVIGLDLSEDQLVEKLTSCINNHYSGDRHKLLMSVFRMAMQSIAGTRLNDYSILEVFEDLKRQYLDEFNLIEKERRKKKKDVQFERLLTSMRGVLAQFLERGTEVYHAASNTSLRYSLPALMNAFETVALIKLRKSSRSDLIRSIKKQFRKIIADKGYTDEFIDEIPDSENLNSIVRQTMTKEMSGQSLTGEVEKTVSKILANAEANLLTSYSSRKFLNLFIEDKSTNLLILLGDFGAGKTTTMRALMNSLSQKKLNSPTDGSIRIPLLISLKNYNKVPDFQHLIRSTLQDDVEASTLSFRGFRKLNEQGKFVLLLDGFDEMMSRVTAADRRRCFREMAEFIYPRSKVIITGRPGFFVTYSEFVSIVSSIRSMNTIHHKVACVQLLDEEQVEEVICKASVKDGGEVVKILRQYPSLVDLARRPVLAYMISQTGTTLSGLKSRDVTARDIYRLYTDRWIRIEEDKGQFRYLIDPEKKEAFVRYLAMQMHIKGMLILAYDQIGEEVRRYFELSDIGEIDHFSHDIRTCSFLVRSDEGNYGFAHKSFMEYFVALEFERLNQSPFKDQFDRSLSEEMIALLDIRSLPPCFDLAKNYRRTMEKLVEALNHWKIRAIGIQDFEVATFLRDLEKNVKKLMITSQEIFSHMDYRTIEPAFDEFAKTLSSGMILNDATQDGQSLLIETKENLLGLLENSAHPYLQKIVLALKLNHG